MSSVDKKESHRRGRRRPWGRLAWRKSGWEVVWGWLEPPDEYRLKFSCRCLKLRMSPEVPRRQAAAKLCLWDLGQGKTAPLPFFMSVVAGDLACERTSDN